jgi:hypothetical protein
MTANSLWIDDIRPIPSDLDHTEWTSALTFHEAVFKLDTMNFDRVSLDHDLGSFYGMREMTGYYIVLWLADRKQQGLHVPSEYFIHSANPIGKRNMGLVIQEYLCADFIIR